MSEMKARDHSVAIFKAGLALVGGTLSGPLAGALSSLIGDYVPKSADLARDKLITSLAEKTAELSDRIDIEAVNKNDFADLFLTCTSMAGRTNREEKLRTAANLLANALLRPDDPHKSPFEELDHFAHCLDRLSAGAISVLGAACSISLDRRATPRSFHFRELAQLFEPGLDIHQVMGLASELRSLNLIHIQEGAIGPQIDGFLVYVTVQGRRFAERFIEGQI